MSIPSDLQYTKSHEWIRDEKDGTVTVGITDHAQELLGDLVFIELPSIGNEYTAGQEAAVVESVKAAADVYAPVDGTVTAINQEVVDSPELVNQQPYEAWLFRIQVAGGVDLSSLLDAAGYQKIVDAA
ncbi:MAG: glycine cleavage system protein GcvH [Candidatus Accumulibacter sp.]|nr:glycine cleavage system protein GcvH [Accumulibacter sp.]